MIEREGKNVVHKSEIIEKVEEKMLKKDADTHYMKVSLDILSYNKDAYDNSLPDIIMKASSKVNILNKIVSHIVSWTINHKLPTKERKILSIDQFELEKRDKGMRLQIEVADVNLDAIFHTIILEKKESQARDQEDGRESQSDLFEMLISLNDNIPTEQKFELIKYFLDWSNKNQVTPVVVDFLIKTFPEIKHLLDSYNLNVGSIKIEKSKKGGFS